MNDTGSMFKDLRKITQKERWSYSAFNRGMLDANAIEYEYHPDTGTALIGDFQFWTTTGRWYNNKTKLHGQGVAGLIEALEVNDDDE